MTPAEFDAALDAEALRRVRERLATGEILTFETQHRRKDGIEAMNEAPAS